MCKEYLFNYMCVGIVSTCVCEGVETSIITRRHKMTPGVLFYHTLPYFLETGSTIKPSTRLVASEPQKSYLHLLHSWGYIHG